MDTIGCRIELLGELRVVHGDHVISRFRTQKSAGLAAYLALFLNQVHPRERIADLFWPDLDPEAGRQNLTTALTSLRRQLEAIGLPAQDVLVSDRHTVRFNPACVTTDLDAFDRLLNAAAAERDPVNRARLLSSAIALYRSEPLPGRYEEWALELQERCAERYADGLDQWCAALEQIEEWQAALDVAMRVERADPYREAPRRVQMRAYAALGRSGTALEVYRQFEALLQETMGATPAPETKRLAERLRQDPRAFEAATSPDSGSLHTISPSRTKVSLAAPVPPCPDVPPPLPTPLLPLQLTRFFGREQEIARLESLLTPNADTGGARLITLTGPGGAGKTRLAVEAGRRAAPAFGGRVWFVDLAGLPGPEHIVRAILSAMKPASGDSQEDPLQAIENALATGPGLILLDNFEHMLQQLAPLDSTALIGPEAVRRLLERAPSLICLITSRQPLRLGGEQEFPVPPLTLPDDLSEEPSCLSGFASIALYTDRAILAKPDFALTQSNAAAVAALCRRLEGIPLAIEMAAAWAKTLTPAKMLERLEHQLDILVSRRRDLPLRHQSLRATIEWSYSLLSPQQQAFLIQLAVFRSGWTLEAVEDLYGLEALELLMELQERSLVVTEQKEEDTRYSLLQTILEFSSERLEAGGQAFEVRKRHCEHYLRLAEASEKLVASTGQVGLLRRLDEERDNLRAAMAFCLAPNGPIALGLRFPVAMHHYWESRGALAEGLGICLALIAHPDAQARSESRANTLQTAFWMAFYQGDHAHGRAWMEESLEILRDVGSPLHLGNGLNAMAAAFIGAKDYARAQEACEESMTIWQQLGDRSKTCRAMHNLASILRARGDIEGARRMFEQCLELNRQARDITGSAGTLQVLSWLYFDQGDLVSARRVGEEALRLNRETGNKTWETFTLCSLAWVALGEGNTEEAAAHCSAGLVLLKDVGSKKDTASALECLAEIAHTEASWERAAQLWGSAAALRTATGRPGAHTNTHTYATKVEETRAALGETSFQAAWDRGGGMTMEQMLEDALRTL
ncbi:MAG: putative ATPase [Chthonomonadales bacterium]|nr:putative ATPase [Chthonomonadales bacterium]